jgi:hypothetical protein
VADARALLDLIEELNTHSGSSARGPIINKDRALPPSADLEAVGYLMRVARKRKRSEHP